MHSRVSILNFILLYIFFQLNAYDTATPRPSRKNNSTSVITSKHSGENGTIFITTKFGTDGETTKQACICTAFYMCASTDFVEISKKNCLGTDVCCLTETPITELPGFGTEKTVTVESPNCQCVPRSECQISKDKKTGLGIIDPKSSQCDNSDDVCCPTTSSPLPVVPQIIKCGERKGVLDVRITEIEGKEDLTATNFGEFPWMASIWKTVSDDVFICGASLLSSNIILTAAHCVSKEKVDELKVRVGDYDVKQQIPEERAPMQEKSVSTVIIHPDFNSQVLFNDLAIIVTAEPFTFEYHVSPVCTFLLSSEFADSQKYNSSKCFATGWGKSTANSEEALSAKLKKVDLQVVPFDQCQENLRKTKLSEFFELDSSFLCAIGKKGFDTCAGDGGGPLFCPLHSNRHQYVQIGVTSWGISCGTEAPGVYASLEANKDWLISVFDQYKTTSDSSVTEPAFRKKP